MAFQYLSREWLEEGRSRVSASPDFAASAKGLTASLINTITEAPGGRTIFLYYQFHEGAIKELTVSEDPAILERPAEFRVSGNYETYTLINQGKLGSTEAVFKRKIKLEGNLAKALRYIRPLEAFNAIVRTVPTVY